MSQMEVDNLKLGSQVGEPQVSASMATALLAYSGIAVKMLVDERLGAALHTMFMVHYQPGGVAHPHDHPLEESYLILDGEVTAEAAGDRFRMGVGDFLWCGAGCVHAFYNESGHDGDLAGDLLAAAARPQQLPLQPRLGLPGRTRGRRRRRRLDPGLADACHPYEDKRRGDALMDRTLIKGGIVLTLDREVGDFDAPTSSSRARRSPPSAPTSRRRRAPP